MKFLDLSNNSFKLSGFPMSEIMRMMYLEVMDVRDNAGIIKFDHDIIFAEGEVSGARVVKFGLEILEDSGHKCLYVANSYYDSNTVLNKTTGIGPALDPSVKYSIGRDGKERARRKRKKT